MIREKKSPWIAAYKFNPQARLRLFCFPFAGGAASVFRSWQEALPETVQVCPLQYPGREERFREPLIKDMPTLVTALAAEVTQFNDLPYIFFGHSMGSLVAFELASLLQRSGQAQPQRLFVSGHAAPHNRKITPTQQMTDEQFCNHLRRYGGTPEAVLQNAELMEIFLPILRADFAIRDNYIYQTGGPLDADITAFAGEQDATVEAQELNHWRELTRSNFTLHTFPGSHFFLQSARTQLLATIATYLTKDAHA
jgi:medium-chain acyl-[acyl-carrier-protein] hydrolase